MALNDSKFVSVILDEDGNQSRQDLFTTNKAGVAMRTLKEYMRLSDSEIIIYGQKDKSIFRFVKLRYL